MMKLIDFSILLFVLISLLALLQKPKRNDHVKTLNSAHIAQALAKKERKSK